MNYYEHHLGDWAKDVRGLSLTEEGAYRRLLDAYYSSEEPLPADEQECFDLAVVRDEKDRSAVRKVLRRFFILAEDGWHQKRADAEIARFRGRSARAVLAANARWNGPAPPSKRNANASPEHVPKPSERNAPAMQTHPPSNAPPMQTQSERNATAYANAMHSQEPVTSNQKPEEDHTACALPHTHASAGEACKAMREAGIADVNPSNPTLLAMLAQGMTVDELRAAAVKTMAAAVGPRRFSYALTVAQNEREKAAAVALAPPSAAASFSAGLRALKTTMDEMEADRHDDAQQSRA